MEIQTYIKQGKRTAIGEDGKLEEVENLANNRISS